MNNDHKTPIKRIIPGAAYIVPATLQGHPIAVRWVGELDA